MSKLNRLALALALTGGMLGLGLLSLASNPRSAVEAAPSQQSPGRFESPCEADAQQLAHPPVMLLGEDTTIQLAVRAACPSTGPTHIVFVLDASGSMAITRTRQMKRAVKAFISRLDMENHPSTKVGVVQFNSTARTLCQLTNETGRAQSCVNKIGANGGTAIDRGMTEGLNVLRKGRGLEGGLIPNEMLILLVDDENNNGCQPVLQASGRAKTQGVLVATVGLGDRHDAACLRQTASSPALFFQSRSATELEVVFQRLEASVMDIRLDWLSVTTIVPENMELVPDSTNPPAQVSEDRKTLDWVVYHVPSQGITLSYRIRPLEIGHHRASVGAWASYRDTRALSGTLEFPERIISALGGFRRPNPGGP